MSRQDDLQHYSVTDLLRLRDDEYFESLESDVEEHDPAPAVATERPRAPRRLGPAVAVLSASLIAGADQHPLSSSY